MQTHHPTRGPSLSGLAAATPPDRNRAVDAYRAIAMIAVTAGHWAATSATLDEAGALHGGNALEHAPDLAWITWVFQVMPLFFCVGGFASAMSLDAHARNGDARRRDWVAQRLRRMLAPTVVLATCWTGLLAVGALTGTFAVVGAGAVAAAIPLWFLANYTIDTAVAPFLLPRFRTHPALVVGALAAVIVTVDRLVAAGIGELAIVNWVAGWLLFQVVGFAWRDGRLPSTRPLGAIAAGLWVTTVAAVAYGPWPTTMVHVPGVDHSPTHPPSIALMLYGLATCATAVSLAPLVDRWLASRPKAWAAVVAGNAGAMTVYLWHMTAMVGAVVVLWAGGWLPTAPVGTTAWWVEKIPLTAIALGLLFVAVASVGAVERRALTERRTRFESGAGAMVATAVAVTVALKTWTSGSPVAVLVGAALLVAVWRLALRPATVAAEVA